MCTKIHNFYGHQCSHFSRQWITTRIPEHNDICGRDGETLPDGMPARGAFGSAGVGAGTYTYRGQCIFFFSNNNDCCSTRAGWREDSNSGGTDDSDYCENRYRVNGVSTMKDNWDSKHRSWKIVARHFTPSAAWPVVSAGRRLEEDGRVLNGSLPGMHELFLPNGTRFWALDDDVDVNANVDRGDFSLLGEDSFKVHDEVVEEAEDGEQDHDEGEEGWNPLQSLWEEAGSLSQLVREEVSTAWEQLWR